MIILGLNAYHGDSSACILVDGKLIAAAEEERFTRRKHWAGFPKESIIYCLNEAGVTIDEIDHIAVNRNPKANLLKKALFAFAKRPSLKLIADRLKNASRGHDLKDILSRELGDSRGIRAHVHNVEHHTAHLASSFFVSPFKEAAVVSIDGFGDFAGAMWGFAENNKIEIKHRTFFPHSLGLYYLALTQYLGFLNYGDEYKVMGLSAYGKPEYADAMEKVVRICADNSGLFELDLDYFIHHSDGITMTWENGKPEMGAVFSKELEALLGPSRRFGEAIDERHMDIAASLQKRYEELLFSILNKVHAETKCDNLALAGGCAMNSLANGKIFRNTPFREVYIQPAASDAGGAVGAAYYVWNHILDKPRSFVLESPYLGPAFNEDEISNLLNVRAGDLTDCIINRMPDKETLCGLTAKEIADGKVIGWFQGRMEWGARALGNRSILCDPRRTDMKSTLNSKIKLRESFRPFAPSILAEFAGEYFETDYPDPFMLKVYKIKPEKQKSIPAVTHVDGTGRIQTVDKKNNELYWQLIESFRKLTGVPVLLNTSFNENEPIVCKPEEALDCFLRTAMDVLVLGNYLIKRKLDRQ